MRIKNKEGAELHGIEYVRADVGTYGQGPYSRMELCKWISMVLKLAANDMEIYAHTEEEKKSAKIRESYSRKSWEESEWYV